MTRILVLAFLLLSSRAIQAAGPEAPAPAKTQRADADRPPRRAASAEERERYAERERDARPLEGFEGGRMSDVALILVIVLIVLIIAILL